MSDALVRPLRSAPQISGLERARVHANLKAKMFGRACPVLRVGRFEVVARVGGGSQGDVYRARDRELGRDVAVKVLRHAWDETSREARALARLSHPNVVQVFATGTQAEVAYVVTEFIRGDALPDWLAQDPGRDERLEVLQGCARGLLAAHRAGLVHGDFKPSNVMVEPGPVARVIDFGVASDADAPTSSGSLEGTEGYIAPERIAGRTGPENDQFALCVVADEVLGSVRVSARLQRALERGRAEAPEDRYGDLQPLIELLGRERAPRRARWLLPSVVATSLGLAAFTSAEDKSLPCASMSAVSRGVWTEQRKASFSEHRDAVALGALGDTWIAEWDAARIASCERGPAAAPEVRCLEGVLAEFDLRLQTVGPPRRGTTVAEALARLAAPSSCAATAPVVASDDDVEALRRARVIGDLEGSEALLAATDELASRIDRIDPAFAARILIVRSGAVRSVRRFDDSSTWLEAAVWKAESAGDAQTAAEAAGTLAMWIVDDDGDMHAANTWLRRAEASALRSPGPDDDREVMRRRARWLGEDGQFDAARALLDTLTETAEGLAGAKVLQERCQLEDVSGNPQAAVDWCERSVDAFAQRLGRSHPSTLHRQQSLGAALEGAGRFGEAREVLEDVVHRLEATGQPVGVRVLNSLAIVLEQLGELDDAMAVYARALEDVETTPDSRPGVREALELNMGTLAMKQGRFEEAQKRYSRSLISMQSRLGAEHPRTMNAHWGLAEALEGQGRYAGARAAIDESIRIGETGGLGPGSLARPRLVRARILVEGALDPEAGRAEAARVLADTLAHTPENVDLIDDAQALLD